MDEAELKRVAEAALEARTADVDFAFDSAFQPPTVLSLLSRLSAAEARVGVLEGLIRQMHDEYNRDEACDYRKINGYISALFQALTQEPTS